MCFVRLYYMGCMYDMGSWDVLHGEYVLDGMVRRDAWAVCVVVVCMRMVCMHGIAWCTCMGDCVIVYMHMVYTHF